MVGRAGEISAQLISQQLPPPVWRRAGRFPGWDQAPDFFIPDELSPIAIIEAKVTSDDGTARDKVASIIRLDTQRKEHAEA
ncbi:MAG: hypothetical protein O7A06_16240, partial [Acidobacteria bacterium]|nr:hypothetical protein [Acidobacteriota bacterium]